VVVVDLSEGEAKVDSETEDTNTEASADDEESKEVVPDKADLHVAASRSLYDIRPVADKPSANSVGSCLYAFTGT